MAVAWPVALRFRAMSDESNRPIIFISYSHDSDEHRKRVLSLSERLRQDGFDTRLDRYVKGTPSNGWPRWMMDGLDEADFVLVVCTETYYRRFRGHEVPGVGKGVDWEGALITQEIYDARSDTAKFVPVLFESDFTAFIPEPIRSHTHYLLTSESHYGNLKTFLKGVAGVEPGQLGDFTPETRPTGTPMTFADDSAVSPAHTSSDRDIAPSRILRHAPDKLFGREPWLAELNAAWANRDSTHVCTLVAWGGVGKTSLVAHWVQQRFVAHDWPGVERYFDWSFYSQGTGESRQTSSDLFISRALTFFGDKDPTLGGPWERGERLARLVRKRRTLLVLDGIEPLQYPAGDPSGQGGMLKDQGLAALLQGLAADNPGLCVVTTRESLANLHVYNDSTSPEHKLDELPCAAAVALLRHLRIDGSDDDLTDTWREAGGHALTLQLLGRYLADAHGGDIRKRDLVDLQEVDRETQGRSAFKVMAAYETWLESAGVKGQRELSILRLTGLFDSPISPDCLAVLRSLNKKSHKKTSGKWREVKEVFGPISKLADAEWNAALKRLESIDLISLSSADIDSIDSLPSSMQLDAHPLIRAYFAEQLHKRHPKAFQAAHSRLFDYLCESTKPHRPEGLDGLQSLYQAIVHGCVAGRQQEACEKVYRDRILRGTDGHGNYSLKKLGAMGSDLSAVANFFVSPWSGVSPNVSKSDQAWLLNEAAIRLGAVGRLTEALEPIRISLKICESMDDWGEAATRASNLSELEVTLGLLESSVADARRSIDFVDRSGDFFQRGAIRTYAADALHQSGSVDEAQGLLAAAERMQQDCQPEFNILYSLQGFRYCDLLLAPAERTAWSVWLTPAPLTDVKRTTALDACTEGDRRAAQTLEWDHVNAAASLLDVALDNLTLARATLYAWLLRADSSSLVDPSAFSLPPKRRRITGRSNRSNAPKSQPEEVVIFTDRPGVYRYRALYVWRWLLMWKSLRDVGDLR
jgi:hypothetical protein